MNINELKVGDRVKYKFNNKIEEGMITEINDTFFIADSTDIVSVERENIISKLEPVYEYSNDNCQPKCTKKLIRYKEIKIQQKYNHREGFEQKFYLNCTCDRCSEERTDKKNNPPKSFKFEFNTRDTDGNSSQPFYKQNDGKFMCGFTEYKGRAWGSIRMPMPNWARLRS